jgi:hypothetical protein
MNEAQAIELLWQVFEVEPDAHGPNSVEAVIFGHDMADCREMIEQYIGEYLPSADPESVTYAPDHIDEDPMTTATAIRISVRQ